MFTKKNLIYVCVFHNANYVDLLELLITSFIVKSTPLENTDFLIVTSPDFKEIIEKKELSSEVFSFTFWTLENVQTLFEAGCARLSIFDYEKIDEYDKILYLDTDILIGGNLDKLFQNDISHEKIYALEEGEIGCSFYGGDFFDWTLYRKDQTAFTSGILFFRNSQTIRNLFSDIQKHIQKHVHFEKKEIPCCLDQPFIIYNAFVQNKYDNSLMKNYSENNPKTATTSTASGLIYHFPGGPGWYESKISKMSSFWKKMNPIPKVLFQTNKTRPKKYVLDLISLKLSEEEWKYEFYDDDAVIDFFKRNPIKELPNILEKYQSISSGAHRADLFRYYYIYVKGGFFMDSDAMICEPLEKIVNDFNFVSVNSSVHPGNIFQGVLGASPRNEIVRRALFSAYDTDPSLLNNHHHYWCRELYKILNQNTFGYQILLLNERRNAGDNFDYILDDKGSVVFKHYWETKIIPRQVTAHKDKFTKSFREVSSSSSSTSAFVDFVEKFIKENETKIKTITDIGCGQIEDSYGDTIANKLGIKFDYLGIDCVEEIVEMNSSRFPNLHFRIMDVVEDIEFLRKSDLYIIKNVLNHWEPKDVEKFLNYIFKNRKENKFILLGSVDNNTSLHVLNLLRENFDETTSDAVCIPIFEEGEKWFLINRFGTCWNTYNRTEIHSFDYRVLTTFLLPEEDEKHNKKQLTLTRVGPKEDGGYVIVDGVGPYDLFISCGIAQDIRFEEAFLQKYPEIEKCFAFDATISSFPWSPLSNKKFEWIPKNIGCVNTSSLTNLKDLLCRGKRIFIKMDIEGSEFNWIDSLTIEEMERISQIVIEIHWPFDVYRNQMLEKLSKTHYIFHIHGNNYCDRDIPKHLPSGRSYDGTATIRNVNLKDVILPEVFEVTYVNKKLFCDENSQPKEAEIIFPLEHLDYPNNPNAKDISFSIPILDKKTMRCPLENSTFTWGPAEETISFLEEGRMEAFGKGNFFQIENRTFRADFGGREHKLEFNEDFTQFKSTRIGDDLIICGKRVS